MAFTPPENLPMNERRAHQCHHASCDTEAKYSVRLHLNCCAPGVVQSVHMNCSIEVCELHRDEVRPFVLSDGNKETITTQLTEAGHYMPDFMSARFEFLPIQGRTVIHAIGPRVMCDRGGCESEAKWQIKQKFRMTWQRSAGLPPVIEVLTKMCVCNQHKGETEPADFLDDESKSATRAWLLARGVKHPDFDTMEIGFIPLVDGTRVDPVLFVGPNQPRDAIPLNGGA